MKKIGLAAGVLLLAGCGASHEKKALVLPEINILDTRTHYAVVREVYIRLREKPGSDEEIRHTVWRNQNRVMEILSKSSELGEEALWYRVQYRGIRGWVSGQDLQIFNNFDEAVKAAQE